MPTDGRALVRAGLSLKPDGLVVEVSSPHLNGRDAAELLKHKLPSLKLVFLNAKSAVHTAAKAHRWQATACALRLSSKEFRNLFPSVMRGESDTRPVIARETIDHLLRAPKSTTPDQRITRREANPAVAVRSPNQVAELENALQPFAFQKYNMMEESRDHPQGRIASVHLERRYGANA
jgi:DNA-binding NarL/FixJ family response regulator